MKVVDKNELRDLMLRDKDFLARLFTSDILSITKKLIVNAESSQLCLLIQILHYLASGSIPKRKTDYAKVCRKQKNGFIFKSFRSLENANKLLNEPRENQCKALTKIAVCYPNLFYLLFNEHEGTHSADSK